MTTIPWTRSLRAVISYVSLVAGAEPVFTHAVSRTAVETQLLRAVKAGETIVALASPLMTVAIQRAIVGANNYVSIQ